MSEAASSAGAVAGALAPLEHAYSNRLAAALAHRRAGGEVVGAIGLGMPLEVAIATGCLPINIAPLPGGPTPFADPWLNPTFDPQKRVILDQLLSGELEFMAVATHVSLALQDSALFQWARQLLAQGEGARMPPLHQYVLLGNRQAPAYEYSLDQTHALARRLRAVTGQAATPDRLADAIVTVNAARAALRELNLHRRAGRVSGVDGLTASAAFRFLPPEVFTEALRAFNAEAAKAPVRQGPRTVAVSAWKLSDTNLHTVLEEGGLNVVAEDDAWGARAPASDIPLDGDLMEQVFRHYHRHTPNRATYPAAVRFGWLYEEASKPDVDVVAFYMPPSDRALGWDYPRLFDHFEALGKRVIKLRLDVERPEDRASAVDAIRRAVAAF